MTPEPHPDHIPTVDVKDLIREVRSDLRGFTARELQQYEIAMPEWQILLLEEYLADSSPDILPITSLRNLHILGCRVVPSPPSPYCTFAIRDKEKHR